MAGFGVDRGSGSSSGSADPAISEALIDAKGDLIAGLADNSAGRLAVGANETRLVADSAQTAGMKWVADTTNYAIAAKGNLLAGTAADTAAALAVGTNKQRLAADSAQSTGLAWVDDTQNTVADAKGDLLVGTAADTIARSAVGDGTILNAVIVASVAGNALTLALKGLDGNDPSATNQVFVAFKNATASSGAYTVRTVTSALSVVLSSGSTLGHASARDQHIFVYLIDNSGTVELAVSNLPPDYPGVFGPARLISTTAEGGAGAADSATGIYSTTARSNLPWVCIAKCISNQTTAGTWAATPTQIDMAPFTSPRNLWIVQRQTNQSIAHGVATKVQLATKLSDPDSIFDAATNYRAQPNIAGPYKVDGHLSVDHTGGVSGDNGVIYLYKNGTLDKIGGRDTIPTATVVDVVGSWTVLLNGTTDYVEIFGYQTNTSAAARDITTATFSGVRVGE